METTYIFKSGQAEGRSEDGGISNLPLGVAWCVVITDSTLCDGRDLHTLHQVTRPWHTIPEQTPR